MKTIFLILFILFFASIIYFFILGIHSRSKDAPGLINGQLSTCPDTPNCVCSENKDHADHYVAPIIISKKIPPDFDSLLTLKNIVKNMSGSITFENKKYFSATFTSSFFRFIDDLEVRIDTDKNVIHIRSASRVGKSDLGVNKKRIELLKQHFKAAMLNK